MTQDTRKDRRVKIVSLNVRYKSATVDEFIENHSHDVSKGGIFIKTGSPFPPGTLLKFEIRLAGDESVVAGVGRVVWKRETPQATADRPAGMGVKFIKLDDASKAVIERLVATKPEAGKAYEGESPAARAEASPQAATVPRVPPAATARVAAPPAVSVPSPTPAPAGAARPETLPGIPVAPPAGAPPPSAGRPAAPAPKPPTADAVRGAAPPSLSPVQRKATMMGLGGIPAPPPMPGPARPADPPRPGAASEGAASTPSGSSAPPRSVPRHDAGAPAVSVSPVVRASETSSGSFFPTASPTKSGSGGTMFPKTNSQGDMPPPQDQTVMRQAAELLEEALKEAGGSIEEVGANPLFAVARAAAERDAVLSSAGSVIPEVGPSAVERLQASPSDMVTAPAPEPLPPAPPVDRSAPDLEATSPSARAESVPAPARDPVPARSAFEAPRAPSHAPPPARISDPPPRKRKGGAGMFIALAVVLLGGAAGVFVFREKIFGGAPVAAPSSVDTATPPSASAAAAEEPSAVAPAEPEAPTPAEDTTAVEAGASTPIEDASVAEAATDAASAEVKKPVAAPPRPRPRPAPPPAAATKDDSDGDEPASPPPAKPSPQSTSGSGSGSESSSGSGSGSGASDNPY